MTRARPSEVARLLGVEPAALRLAKEGSNTHWYVRSASGLEVVLRRYRAGQTAVSLRYEAAVLHHLRERGWPVAAPLTEPLEVGGRWWAVFPRLPGREHDWTRHDPRHRWRGELLARMHVDTADLVRGLGQRDGFHRRDEAPEITPEHVTLLARLRRLDRPRAVSFERHARQIAEGAAFLRANAFPLTIVHGDFMPWNLRVRGRVLEGILDFDGTRLDSRAADLAFATWGGRYAAVCDGYSDVTPISEEEEAALPLLWRAAWLDWGWTLVARSRDRVEPELDAVLEKLARPWGE